MIRILAEAIMVLIALFHHGRHFGPIGVVRDLRLHVGCHTERPRHQWAPQTGELAHFGVTRHAAVR